MTQKYNIYLDDIRTPVTDEWIVVRSYDEFVAKITELGLDNIEYVSLDHDLGDTAMKEYFENVSPNYKLDYSNIHEKTGLDCAKWLINNFYDVHPEYLVQSNVHSANPIGSANIMGYINNFLMNEAQPQDCVRVQIEHTVE
jgi:hypothetical protein